MGQPNKVKVTLRDRNIPARREAEIIEDQDWQGGGYVTFETDDNKSSSRSLSLGYVDRNKRHYELIEEADETEPK